MAQTKQGAHSTEAQAFRLGKGEGAALRRVWVASQGCLNWESVV